MNFISRSLNRGLTMRLRVCFGNNAWREREESAEKVYISQEEKKLMSKLLGKIEQTEHSQGVKDIRFETSLKSILKAYGISNQSFQAEVVNLHRQD